MCGAPELPMVLNLLQAESVLSVRVMRKKLDLQARINSTTDPPNAFNVLDASLIIRSSDLVDFRVHKSVLAMVSPFFEHLRLARVAGGKTTAFFEHEFSRNP